MSQIRHDPHADIHALIAQRWSPRAFDASRLVDDASLTSLLEAARWAPSCFGDEPWRILVGNRFENEAAWQLMLSILAEKNQLWAKHAPVLLLVCADTQFRQNGKPNRWAQYDTGAAAVSLCLQAVACGLSAHQMGGFDVEKARQFFGVPEQFTPMSVIAVGHQADAETLDEDFRQIEEAPRKRREPESLFYTGGHWPEEE